jgi:hypothetical protein
MENKIYEAVLKEKEATLKALKEELKQKEALEKYHIMLDLGLYETIPLYNEELFDYRNSFTGNDGQRYKLVPLELSDEDFNKVKAIDDEIKRLKAKKRLKNDTFFTRITRIISISLMALSILLTMIFITLSAFRVAALLFIIGFSMSTIILIQSEHLRKHESKKSD